jgi:hypothetical protein
MPNPDHPTALNDRSSDYETPAEITSVPPNVPNPDAESGCRIRTIRGNGSECRRRSKSEHFAAEFGRAAAEVGRAAERRPPPQAAGEPAVA